MAPFDPYHKWLGIPPEQQPVSHYRLLGIEDFESDADVIEGAAERQTVYLRTFQTGPNAELAERLLNEVSAARVCLLDGKSKDRYDTQLRATLEPEDDPLGFTPEELAPVASRASTRQRLRKEKPFWQEPWATAGGGAIVMLLIMLLFGSGEEAKEPGNKSTNTTPGNQQKTQPTASNETLPAKVAVAPPLAVAPFDAAQATAHQQSWSKHLGVPVEYTNSIGMKFMLIPPGEFMMGASSGADIQKPPRQVMLTKAFEIGIYEVTQEQYARVMQSSPSAFKGAENPVDQVSWTDAFTFCQLLSQLPEETSAGYVYRLPTEAEWEYACRAGKDTAYSFGDSTANYGSYAWFNGNSGRHTHPVGQKKPNAWGLYDVHGNVWEWCHDWHADLPSGSVADPTGPALGSRRVAHGGGYYSGRIVFTNRMSQPSDYRKRNHGFRVVLEIPVKAQPNTIAAETKSLPPSLQQGLIAYYPFNGNANDESGGGNDAEVRGALLSVDRHGKPRKAYSFDGTDQISVQRPTGLQAINAVNCWFKTNAIGANQYLVDLGTINNNWMEILRNGKLLAANTQKAQIHTGQFAAGQWYMVTRTYDGSYLSAFINGRLSASLETPEEVPTGINIGANGKGQFGLNGSIDDIRIYNRALSAEEVKALYEFEKP